ncbi:polysaccharide pyruvyl transferase family protein [Catenovulum agarivorans]|nr:polysaccharide pyruvyl transferase family protein [Catenovulum agarivorans]
MMELNLDSLEQLLKSFEENVYFYPNPGNAGDSLIACATFQFFDKIGLNYELVKDASFDATGKTVMYGGGGNFGGEESRAGQFVKKYKDTAKNLVFLPHTIFGAEQLLASLKSNAHIICRERVSYDHVNKTSPNAHVYLHDDIVFQSDHSKFIAKEPKVNFLPYLVKEFTSRLLGQSDYDFGLSLKGYLSYKAFLKTIPERRKKNDKVLKAFRVDVERTSDVVPEGNVDLSAVLELSSCQKDLAALSCYHFLNEINAYEEVHTNRLHIAIGAACLGKNVKLHANNYFKIRAIYEYSILGKFDNVEWVDN